MLQDEFLKDELKILNENISSFRRLSPTEFLSREAPSKSTSNDAIESKYAVCEGLPLDVLSDPAILRQKAASMACKSVSISPLSKPKLSSPRRCPRSHLAPVMKW